MSIFEKIEQIALQNPSKVAFSCRDGRLTYGELKQYSDNLAQHIIGLSGNNKQPIIVYGHKQPLMLVVFLAAIKSGHPYIPVDFATPKERVDVIIENSKASLLFCISPLEVTQLIKTYTDTDVLQIAQQPNNVSDLPKIAQGGDVYAKYTSGSTGVPKGVRITHTNLEYFIDWAQEIFTFKESDIVLNQVAFSFDVSVIDLYLTLSHGGTVWVVDKEMILKPKLLFDAFVNSGISIWVSTPSFVEYCLIDRSFNSNLLSKLKTFILAGEVLSNECVRKILARFPGSKVFNGYGPTEATVLTSAIMVDETILNKYNPLPIGFPPPYLDIEIASTTIDSDDEPNKKGEIIIKGGAVSPGYLNDPVRTAQSFYNEGNTRCYRAGDIGYFDQGMLFYCGRVDNQIKLSGYRIELEEIECKINSIHYVNRAVVLPNIQNGKCISLTAIVVFNQLKQEVNTKLRTDLLKLLPSYMIPNKFIEMEKMPITANGKIDKDELRKVAS